MRGVHFSVARLITFVVLFALGLAALQSASSPWSGSALSVALSVLTLSLLGAIFRRGERRAFWIGFALCGWSYMAFSFGPWFGESFGPRLATTRLLAWSYPWLVPTGRQADSTGIRRGMRRFEIQYPVFGEGINLDKLINARIDVSTVRRGDSPPASLAKGVRVTEFSTSGYSPGTGRVSVEVDLDKAALLETVLAEKKTLVLTGRPPGLFSSLWLDSPVDPQEYQDVGHSLFALLSAWVGSLVARYFHGTRNHVS